MRTVYFKRGAKFEIEVELIDVDESPIVVPVDDMKAQIRDNQSNLVCELDIEEGDEDGVYILTTDDDTSDWPIQNLKTDIQMYMNSDPYYSETITIQVIKQETII